MSFGKQVEYGHISFSLFDTEMNSDLGMQQNHILSLEKNVVAQDIRLDVVEDDVDEWDDKITSLEVANVDITDRLITIEEIILG